MFFGNDVRDVISESMGERDEDSVGDIKILQENQMNNPEDNQQEQVTSKNGFEFAYEKDIQVSEKSSNRVVYQDQKILNQKSTCLF